LVLTGTQHDTARRSYANGERVGEGARHVGLGVPGVVVEREAIADVGAGLA
jgi:hypothetical protein